MPIIYLSPSTQEWNYYVNGGTEEEYMNLLADKMVPYLDASGIRYDRNTPSMTAADSIAASNAGNFDLTWPSTPTPPLRDSTALPEVPLLSITPAASRASGPPTSSPTICAPSTPCRTRSGRYPPQRWAKCGRSGPLPSSWS